MRNHHFTLVSGLLLAAGLLGLLEAALPLVPAGALCPNLALEASPARLVSQMQTGFAALLGCGRD